MLKILSERFISVAAVLMMAAQGVGGTPDSCVLCSELPIHAPCLVSLDTGQVTELAIYEPDAERTGELATIQNKETFSFVHCAEAKGYCDTSEDIVVMELPENADTMKSEYFCPSCLELMTEYFEESFVLADMYISGSPVLYPVSKGVNYKIRCYEIEVGDKITVTGTLK